MTDKRSTDSLEVSVAELAGFLNGVCYLNQDRKSNFAEAFLLREVDEEGVLAGINAVFKENPIPSFKVRREQEISNRDLERELSTSILVNSYVDDGENETSLGKYISFKIMDRIDSIFKLRSLDRIRKLMGSFGEDKAEVTFYCFTRAPYTLVIYLYAAAPEGSP